MAIKIAFIGAGSVGFTRRLFRDVLTVPELADTRFALTDINRHNLDMVTQLCRKDLRNNRLPAKITATLDRRRAVADADYIINCVRVGGLEAFQLDIDIQVCAGSNREVFANLPPGTTEHLIEGLDLSTTHCLGVQLVDRFKYLAADGTLFGPGKSAANTVEFTTTAVKPVAPVVAGCVIVWGDT